MGSTGYKYYEMSAQEVAEHYQKSRLVEKRLTRELAIYEVAAFVSDKGLFSLADEIRTLVNSDHRHGN